MVKKQVNNHRIGLTLSGGWANGFTHIGALMALERAHIPISAIAGCSMGSIIGACYAAGKTPLEIEHFVIKHKMVEFIQLSISKLGISDASKLKKAIQEFLGVTKFEELKIPLYINATDLSTGKEVIFSSGDLFEAVRASIAIPGIFSPHLRKGFLVDGGVLNNIPFSILPKNIKKHIIIDALSFKPVRIEEKPNMARIMEASGKLAMHEIFYLKLRELNKNDYVVITPKIPHYGIMPSRNKLLEIISNGEKATNEKIPEIKRKLLK